MLVKEYRIPLPLTVDEYRIAQLYMIAKKSRNETEGEGSGVEIIINEPYADGPGGSGQYTKKIYHVGSHLPGWLKSLLPKSALTMEEEAWNAYPYTRTRYTCPFVEKFSIDIDTRYFNDGGHQENVFCLDASELAARHVDVIDVVKDLENGGGVCVESEDPRLYVSKTGRGPLAADWISDYWRACQDRATPLDNGMAIMCAYKLCKVDFRYWGMQTKVEKFIHDVALRRTMLSAHCQAWAWQDEWCGMTLADIRRIESETQRVLAQRFGAQLADDQDDGDESGPGLATAQPAIHSAKQSSDEGGTGSAGAWPLSSLGANDNDQYSLSDDEFFDCPALSEAEPEGAQRSAAVGAGQHCSSSSSRQGSGGGSGSSTGSRGGGGCQCEHLLLVVHAGSITDCQSDSANVHTDFNTFRAGLELLIRTDFASCAAGRVATRLVQCAPLCVRPLQLLNSLSVTSRPHSSPPAAAATGLSDTRHARHEPGGQCVAAAAVPLLLIADAEYGAAVVAAARAINSAFRTFTESPEGGDFCGHVSIVADAAASLLVYDILTHDGRECGQEAVTRSHQKPLSVSPSPVHALSSAASQLSSVKRRCSLDDESCASHSQSLTVQQYHHIDGLLDFNVADVFMLGSPLALVLAFRSLNAKTQHSIPARPRCRSVFNLFHASNALAFRLEPLLCAAFCAIPPLSVARHQRFPLGDGQPLHLFEYIYGDRMFGDATACRGGVAPLYAAHRGRAPYHSQCSGDTTCLETVDAVLHGWWGDKRIDFALYSPGGLACFPAHALPALFHSSFWESYDVMAFILRCMLHFKPAESDEQCDAVFAPPVPREKWLRKRTSVKIKNISSNHRANDVLVREDRPQTLVARFSYGPLDLISLSGEKVDVFVSTGAAAAAVGGGGGGGSGVVGSLSGQWRWLDTLLTDKSGRLSYQLSEQHALGVGFHSVNMVVKGDHTVCLFSVCVVPPHTECVVFSVDGSFTASVSMSGRDPKVRASAVHVARHWQELGYLLLYVTARPDLQRRRVLSWLEQHCFPRGLVFFTDGICAEPLKRKAEFLRKLVEQTSISIHAAYGSGKDVPMYTNLGLAPSQIYIVGSSSKSDKATYLNDGYASHLMQLASVGGSRAAQATTGLFLPRGNFETPSTSNNTRHSTPSRVATMPAVRGAVCESVAVKSPRTLS